MASSRAKGKTIASCTDCGAWYQEAGPIEAPCGVVVIRFWNRALPPEAIQTEIQRPKTEWPPFDGVDDYINHA